MKKTCIYMIPQKPQFILETDEPKAIVKVTMYTIDLPQTAAEHEVDHFRIKTYEQCDIDVTVFRLSWHCKDCNSECITTYSVINAFYKKGIFPVEEILRQLWQNSMRVEHNGHFHDSAHSMIEFAKMLRGLPDAPDPQDFFDGVYKHHVYPKDAAPVDDDESDRLSLLAAELPGVEETVKCPCDAPCPDSGKVRPIFNTIMHLNDIHKWPREDVADWLDSVDDPEQGIDLAFSMPEEEKS